MTKDEENNIKLLRQVLNQLIKYNIKLKPEKCSLLQPSIKYLGYEFEWSEKCDKAFEELKTRLINPPVLVYPRFDYPFVITSDASEVPIAAILSDRIDGEERPIQYFSKTLNAAQRNYSTIELELFAIIASIRHWSCYFHNKFYVISDYKPIEYLFNSKHNSSRIHRW